MSETQVAAGREDSISSQDPNNPENKEKKAKSRRPGSMDMRRDSRNFGLTIRRYCFPTTKIEGLAVSI